MNNLLIVLVVISGLFSWYQWDQAADAEKKLSYAVSEAAQAQVAKNLCEGTLDTQSSQIREWQDQADARRAQAESAMKTAQDEVDRQAVIIDNLRRTPAKTCEEVRLKMEGDALNDN